MSCKSSRVNRVELKNAARFWHWSKWVQMWANCLFADCVSSCALRCTASCVEEARHDREWPDLSPTAADQPDCLVLQLFFDSLQLYCKFCNVKQTTCVRSWIKLSHCWPTMANICTSLSLSLSVRCVFIMNIMFRTCAMLDVFGDMCLLRRCATLMVVLVARKCKPSVCYVLSLSTNTMQ